MVSEKGTRIMVRRYRLLLIVVGAFLGTAWSLYVPVSVADEEAAPAAKEESRKKPGNKKIAMKVFMRKKLEASQSVIEGLALEDFDLIASGAKQLKTTSAAAEFLVIRDPLYSEYADEFRRIIEKMEKAAKEKRIDGATLAYMDMTMSCVECHKYVRNVLVAK
jgi:hypothetical protein